MFDSIWSIVGMIGIGAIVLAFTSKKTNDTDKIEVQQKVDKIEQKIDNNNKTIEDVKKEAENEKNKDISKEQLVDFFNNWLNKQ